MLISSLILNGYYCPSLPLHFCMDYARCKYSFYNVWPFLIINFDSVDNCVVVASCILFNLFCGLFFNVTQFRFNSGLICIALLTVGIVSKQLYTGVLDCGLSFYLILSPNRVSRVCVWCLTIGVSTVISHSSICNNSVTLLYLMLLKYVQRKPKISTYSWKMVSFRFCHVIFVIWIQKWINYHVSICEMWL